MSRSMFLNKTLGLSVVKNYWMEKMIIIDVIYTSEQMVSIKTSLGQKVVEFKENMAQIFHIHANEFRLTYNGMTLEDDRTLDSYGIKKLDTLHMEVAQNPLSAEMETTPSSDTTTGIQEYQVFHMEVADNPHFAETETTPPSDTTTSGLGLPTEEIDIDIICSNRDMFSVTSSVGSKVVDFKEDLAEISYFPANEQRLIYRGMTLEDNRTLDSYGLQEHHTIHMELTDNPQFAETETTPPSDTTTGALDPPTEKVIMIDIICLNEDMFSVTSSVRSKVVDFKELLAQISHIPANEQRLIYRGITLKDDRTLDSYGLQEDHTIHMESARTRRIQLIPAISLMMQTFLSNPQYMEQIIDQNPQLHDFIPQLQEMMQNAEVVRRLTSPQMLEEMMSSPLLPELNQQSPLRILPVHATPVPLEQLFATQLSQLQETSDENIRALSASGGNVDDVLMRGIGYFGP